MLFQSANLFLRGINLISKFLLIIFVAKTLSPENFAVYGLFVVAVSYGLYFIGFDFYIYSTRELIKSDKLEYGRLIKSQVAFMLGLYFIVLPLSLGLFYFNLLPWELLGWFFLLLIFEHINQEIMRFFIVLYKPLLATFMLFVRSGLWAIILVTLVFFDWLTVSLTVILLAWMIGEIVALTLGLALLRKENIVFSIHGIDKSWILKGIRVCLPFLIGTLALRGLWTTDRFFFEALNATPVLAAYTLFASLSVAMSSLIDAGVSSYIYPKMIDSYNCCDYAGYQRNVIKMLWHTLFISLVFILCSYFLIGYLLDWLGKGVYIEHRALFYWLLVANCFYCLSSTPHYMLYAQEQDVWIIFLQVIALSIFVIFVIVLRHWISNAYLVPLGLCLAFFVLLITKSTIAVTHYLKDLRKTI